MQSEITMECSAQLTHTVPDIFCWTKMGAEAGQGLESILRRKELERQAGDGSFAWGIGNSLGASPALAREVLQNGEIEVLFSPMKSAPKSMDAQPSELILWLAYHSIESGITSLPAHMLVTSRGATGSGLSKRSHYALLCQRKEEIRVTGAEGVIDAKFARNLISENPLGASQVTAMVRYSPLKEAEFEKPYLVSFRARMHQEGFVRLAIPVPLKGALLEMYSSLCEAPNVEKWITGVSRLKRQALGLPEQFQDQPLLL